MGKPKKVKGKEKLLISSPKEGKIVKKKLHKTISNAKGELQPNETHQKVQIQEKNNETILKAKDDPQPSETRVTNKIEEQNKETSDAHEFVGFIFMCNTQTKPECYHHRVFGLPKDKEQVVLNIKRGAKLFLYDFDLKLLYGIYTASSNGGMNLEPKAFGGRYPAQVKFHVHKDCLPVAGHAFKHAIKDAMSNFRFRIELNAQQVENLCKLFQPIGSNMRATAPEPVYLPPALHVRDPIPLYPTPDAPHHHVLHRRSPRRDAVQPPSYRQYPVTSQQQVPGPSSPRISHYPVESVRDEHPVAALEIHPYRSVPQDHRFSAPLPAPAMVPRGSLLRGREYHLVPLDRDMARHYAVPDYEELGPPHDPRPSVGPLYREVVRLYAEPRTETASLPVSSKYSFAGSVPLYR